MSDRAPYDPDPLPKPEWFHFLAASWNVTDAWKLVKGKQRPKQVSIGVESWATNMLGAIRINEAHAMEVDLSKPCLLVWVQHPTDKIWSPMLIDGWHRLYKAHNTGVPRLPAYMLNKKESLLVRAR